MKNKLTPLQPGDIVDLIAPASKANKEHCNQAIKWLESQGLKPRFTKGFNSGSEFFASSESKQWNDLKNAITAKDSKAIWCLRGGWGTMRFIPQLLKMKAPSKPKFFLGYSDITSLHLFLGKSWNWTTYHSHNLSHFGSSFKKSEQTELFNILMGKTSSQEFKKLKPLNQNKKQLIKAKIIGGNLCMVAATQSSKLDFSAKSKIVFFEDTGERGYQIDRYFEQLYQNNFFKGAKAIILGDFTGGLEPSGRDMKQIAIKRLLDKVNIPVLKGLPCGHGKNNRLLPLNSHAQLDLKNNNLIVKTGI